MDLAHAQQVFEQLDSGFSGYDIARSEKERMGRQEAATTYGEVIPTAFYDVMLAAEPKEGEVFFDLGSGTGKATISRPSSSPSAGWWELSCSRDWGTRRARC